MDITAKAQDKVDQTLSDGGYLRVSVDGGGCSGFKVGLSRETNQEETDIRLTHNILIDPISEGYLEEATLDWIDDPFQATFHIEIPKTYSCGCGSSFQIEDERA